tara:strand:- start:89 stop:757 length:669 start_codon:yes stop_codon:yes gene_type:complete
MTVTLPAEIIDRICYMTDDFETIKYCCSDYYYRKYAKKYLNNALKTVLIPYKSPWVDKTPEAQYFRRHTPLVDYFNKSLINIPGTESNLRFTNHSRADTTYIFGFRSKCNFDFCNIIHTDEIVIIGGDRYCYDYDMHCNEFPEYIKSFKDIFLGNYCFYGTATSFKETVDNKLETDHDFIDYAEEYIKKNFNHRPYQLKNFSMQFHRDSIVATNDNIRIKLM